jgi:peptidyl-prolyl cis-trans isomerase C
MNDTFRSLLSVPLLPMVYVGAGILLVGCSPDPKPLLSPDIVATIGDATITIEDVKAELDRRVAARRPVPEKKVLLEEMIERVVFLQRAKMAGLDRDAEVVRAHENMLIGKLREAELTPKLEAAVVAGEEAEAYYHSHLDQYKTPERARLAILFLSANPKGPAEAVERTRARADSARTEALAAPQAPQESRLPGFGALAVKVSEDQSTRYKGGDIGWIEKNRFPARIPPAVAEAGLVLQEPGSIAELVETETGFYVVKLLEKSAESLKPLERVRPAIDRILLKTKREEIARGFEDSMREGLEVVSKPEALAGIAFPARPEEKEDKPGPPALR